MLESLKNSLNQAEAELQLDYMKIVYEGMTEEELFEAGINASAGVHVDFMVGTADLSIIGTTHDGEEIPVFVNGNFAI